MIANDDELEVQFDDYQQMYLNALNSHHRKYYFRNLFVMITPMQNRTTQQKDNPPKQNPQASKNKGKEPVATNQSKNNQTCKIMPNKEK